MGLLAREWFLQCVFWFAVALVAAMGIWELIDRLQNRERSEEKPLTVPEAESESETEEWDNLSEEDRAYLRRYFGQK
jgi:membrane protein implicated in regulation of membrane protease activity